MFKSLTLLPIKLLHVITLYHLFYCICYCCLVKDNMRFVMDSCVLDQLYRSSRFALASITHVSKYKVPSSEFNGSSVEFER